MRRAPVVAGAIPLALALVVGVEIVLAASAEYLPHDPGYRIDRTVVPEGVERAHPVRIAVLGDSTVAGVGSPTVDEALPVLVGERVARALGRPVRVLGLGTSGARTETVRTEQVPLLPEHGLDAVVVVVGANDVTHLTPVWAMDGRTRALIAAVRDRTDAPVVLGGIPLFGSATALAQPLRALVDAYAVPLRAQQRGATTAAGARFVDIAALASPRFRGVPEAMSEDGFHPAPVGYGFWADALAPAVVAALRADD